MTAVMPPCPQCGESRLRRVRNARRRLSCSGCHWQGPDPRTAMQVTDAPAYETTALIPEKSADALPSVWSWSPRLSSSRPSDRLINGA